MNGDPAPRDPLDGRDPPPDARLTGSGAPAERTPAAEHEDALSPAKIIRDLAEEGRTERIGSNSAVENPLTSPPATEEGERPPL